MAAGVLGGPSEETAVNHRWTAVLALATLATAATGCATKKFVRKSVDPISAQLAEAEKRDAENAAAIRDLDEKTQRAVSRVDEKAGAADARAAEAAEKAARAGAQASLATERADGARSLAETSLARAGELERVVESLDNFDLASSKTVYFGFDKSALRDEDKQQLDELAKSLGGTRRYVVEVQGFTDGTGSSDYNYALSGKRADAVARYLTTEHKIPVYRVHKLALGKDVAVEPNKTAAGRKMNRRVEVRVYTQKRQELARQAAPSN